MQNTKPEETEQMKQESQKQREQRVGYQNSMGMRGMEYDRFKVSEEEEKQRGGM
jgi:hypothetical protein